jgi:hypothetical protein
MNDHSGHQSGAGELQERGEFPARRGISANRVGWLTEDVAERAMSGPEADASAEE